VNFGNQLLAYLFLQFGENAGKTLREKQNENFACQQRLKKFAAQKGFYFFQALR
jgi:hypothetical protein